MNKDLLEMIKELVKLENNNDYSIKYYGILDIIKECMSQQEIIEYKKHIKE